MIERLITFWQEFMGPAAHPYQFVHPADQGALAAFCANRAPFEIPGPIGEVSWAQYLANWYGDEHANRRGDLVELSLLPHPYSGSLTNASVFVLSMNGGASDSWYRELHLDELRRARYLAELFQQNGPNWNQRHSGFDINNCGTSAFSYWGERNYDLASAIANAIGQNIGQTYDFMAREIATLELVAYPSRNSREITSLIPRIPPRLQRLLDTRDANTLRNIDFGAIPDWGEHALTSGVRMLAALWNELVPSALEGIKTIIVTRGVRRWGFSNCWIDACPNVIVYPRQLAQAARLGSNTPGGQAILHRLYQRHIAQHNQGG
ncbi:MAG: hypothetical protein HOP13_09755 [Alphaproteobacteria bacterium]|nr:hypothetical protein [Alphaproteobacteria bacterium]